ncbi:hypothetical protein [Levilactobacillus lindianensis]|uniref:hypothetical protein n=1 Tax=Levilactobacillus lindianensis TaxID=2486018 RepID=UPI000F735B43|nr:hypothetical protein [Levilactobacillus lindianensis]
MTKEEILTYLFAKRDLTAGVQDARHDAYEAKQAFEAKTKSLKRQTIWIAVGGFFLTPIVVGMVAKILGDIIGLIGIFAWWGALIYAVILYFQKKKAAAQVVEQANEKVTQAMSEQAYIDGKADFPDKFYSFWTIDRLIHLINENRATSLQEAFNVAETQDFQNDQLSLQQENLAVSQSTNKMSAISAAANVFTAFNTRK